METEEIFMRDFLTFKRMITPYLIQAFFWFGTIMCIIAAANALLKGHGWLIAIQTFIIGPFLVRIVSELLIILFRIDENLVAIRKNTTAK